MSYRPVLLVALLLAVVAASRSNGAEPEPPPLNPAVAEPRTPDTTTSPSKHPSDDEWQFRVAVPMYAWWPNWKGSLSADTAEVDFDLSHRDVIDLIGDDFRGIWTFFGAANRGRLGARLDVFWIWVEDVSLADLNLAVPTPFKLQLDQEYKELMVHASTSWRLFDEPLARGPFTHLRFEPLVGFLFFYLDAEGTIRDSRIPSLNGVKALDDDEHYFELFPLGAEIELGLSERWSLFGRGMFGGWGMLDSKRGTDYMIDAVVKYRFADRWAAEAGMRWFQMNVEGDNLDYEVDNAYGPVLAVIWTF